MTWIQYISERWRLDIQGFLSFGWVMLIISLVLYVIVIIVGRKK